jgi:hypothetical protein
MDPFSTFALGAAIGSVSGKLAEKAWDSGEKWLKAFFANHSKKVQETARANSLDFLTELANRVNDLEDQNEENKKKIQETQDQPDFSILLQKAILTAAQTDNKDKQQVLAQLVAQRLTVNQESVYALASKMACDSLSFMTPGQIRILAFIANIYAITPVHFPPSDVSKDNFQEWMDHWLTGRLHPYSELHIGNQDIRHLESLSCIKRHQIANRDINKLFSKGNYMFDFNELENKTLRNKVLDLWQNKSVRVVSLTTTGEIIGILASDIISGTKTTFSLWE